MPYAMISIIIPVRNEAALVPTLGPLWQCWARDHELIFVDGHSDDRTVELLTDLGLRVERSPQAGRAAQMNWGAKQARGEILLFLHGDTQLPEDFAIWIARGLGQAIAGSFRLQIASPAWSLRWIAFWANQRSRWLGLPYGDQGLFLRRDTFEQLGGFPHQPILEDWVFVQHLKRRGKLYLAPRAVLTSPRRWQQLGVWRTTWINQRILWGYGCGEDLHQLRQRYRQEKS